MKFVKGISLFFIYPMVMFGLGFYVGVESMHFFYPGTNPYNETKELPEENWPEQIVDKLNQEKAPLEKNVEKKSIDAEKQNIDTEKQSIDTEKQMLMEVTVSAETLSVDTEYVLEETDIINHSVVETVSKLPGKYVGLNREQFLKCMEEYEMFPPLSELERGFVSLEVLSFSRERVVVQMNYQYVQPGNSFYLAVRDNEVVVYLEDKETIYINTGIALEELPESVQLDIIQMLWIEDEEALYNFLENYSS